MQSEASKGLALSAPASVYVGFLVAVPLGILVVYSFWTQTYVEIDRTFTLANYREALTDPLVRHLLIRSVLIAAGVTVATVALAYPIAYFIAFRTQKKTLWLLLITIPFWSSYLLRVFAWKLILGFNGVMNSAFMSLGLIDEPLAFLLYNEAAVVLTLAYLATQIRQNTRATRAATSSAAAAAARDISGAIARDGELATFDSIAESAHRAAKVGMTAEVRLKRIETQIHVGKTSVTVGHVDIH